MLSKKLLDESFFTETEIPDLIGFRIISIVPDVDLGGVFCLETDPDAWLDKFKIYCEYQNNSYRIFVSRECPEIYDSDPTDLVDALRPFFEEVKSIYTNIIDLSSLDWKLDYNSTSYYGDITSTTATYYDPSSSITCTSNGSSSSTISTISVCSSN